MLALEALSDVYQDAAQTVRLAPESGLFLVAGCADVPDSIHFVSSNVAGLTLWPRLTIVVTLH